MFKFFRKNMKKKVRDFFTEILYDETIVSDKIKKIALGIVNQLDSVEKNNIEPLLIGYYNYVLCYYEEFSFTLPETATAAINHLKFNLEDHESMFTQQLIDFGKQTENKPFLLPEKLSGTIPPFLTFPGREKLFNRGEYLNVPVKGAHKKVKVENPEDSSQPSP